MSRRTRIALAAAVAALSLVVVVAPASAGKTGPNNQNAKKCQSYLDWVRADGSAFQSSDECAAYAAKGGHLLASTPRTDLSLSMEIVPVCCVGQDGIQLTVTNSGPVSATYSVEARTSNGAQVGWYGIFLASGESQELGPHGFINSVAGASVYAQVVASSVPDPDSTPGNYANGFDGPAVEDDEAFLVFPSA